MPEAHLPFEVCLAQGFVYDQVEITWSQQASTLPEDLEREISAFWQQKLAQSGTNRLLYNGTLCRLIRWQCAQEMLRLELGITNYQQLLYSNHVLENIKDGDTAPFNAAALGVSIVLVSADEQILLMQRSESVGEFPGCLDVFGGHIEPEHHMTNSIPDPFKAIAAELQEEAGIRVDDVRQILCIGLLAPHVNQKPELIFSFKSVATSRKLIRQARHTESPEIAGLLTVPNSKDALSIFLNSKADELSPSAHGTLWVHLQNLKHNGIA